MKFLSQQEYQDLAAVKDECPGSAEIVEVEGGWAVFDSAAEEKQWQDQK